MNTGKRLQALVLSTASGISGPSNVGYLNNGGNGSAATVTVSTPGDVQSGGQLIILAVAAEESFSAAPTITGISGGGGTWEKAVNLQWTEELLGIEMWYNLTPTGGPVTATITWSSAVADTSAAAWIGEMSGMGAVDVTGTITSDGTSLVSPSLTPTADGEFVIFFGATEEATTGFPSSPWTNDNSLFYYGGSAGQDGLPISYQIDSADTATSVTWTTGSGENAAIGAAFTAE